MPELLRCPFCGASPRTEVRVTQKGGNEDHVDFSVHCPQCGTNKTARLKIVAYCLFLDVEKAMNDAIEAWNRRVDGQTDGA